MPKAPATVADAVARRARWLNWYALRLERHGLSTRDLNQVYAGAFISFHMFLERSIEELFLGTLVGAIDYGRPEIVPLATFSSLQSARQIVYGSGRRYADWLPYGLTNTRAKTFLRNGKPFTDLVKGDQDALDRLGVLRNAMSHESIHAMTRFTAEFVNGRVLPPDQKRPAGYLRGMHAARQTRLEFLFTEAVAVMRRLCT